MKSLITLLFILIFFSFFACQNDASLVGGKWVESSFRNVQTDTCTVLLSTVLSDSLATSGDTVCQIGHRKDALWGEITASFYAEYEVPSVSFDESIDYLFDSITIRLYSSGDYLGDTLVTQRISMYPLTENIQLDDANYLYSTSNIAYDSQNPLSSFSFTPTPGRRSSPPARRMGQGMVQPAAGRQPGNGVTNLFSELFQRYRLHSGYERRMRQWISGE